MNSIVRKIAAGANGLFWAAGAWMTWTFLDQLRSAPNGWKILGSEIFTAILVPLGLLAGALPAYLIYRRTGSLRWKRVALITLGLMLAVVLETWILI